MHALVYKWTSPYAPKSVWQVVGTADRSDSVGWSDGYRVCDGGLCVLVLSLLRAVWRQPVQEGAAGLLYVRDHHPAAAHRTATAVS